MSRPVRTDEQYWNDFMARVLKVPAGCWEFQGCRNRDGYGRFSLDATKKPQYWQAHRYAYVHFHGEIPEGKIVCHHCDNPPCVKPEHLYAGTHKENMHDASVRERLQTGEDHIWTRRPDLVRKGERHHNARLKTADVIAIRQAVYNGARHVDLAKIYEISLGHLGEIVASKSWKSIPDTAPVSTGDKD